LGLQIYAVNYITQGIFLKTLVCSISHSKHGY
jgi:hypothetical protein